MENDFRLIQRIQAPELTTAMLLALLSEYSDPRKKLNSFVQKGYVKPIKQGIYLASESLNLRPFSKELLANLIYGPSYISLESALSNYGILPERVYTTTSICLGKARTFSTPVGDFEYHHVKDSIYPQGVTQREIAPGAFCQYASPEKALLDFLYTRETKNEFKNSHQFYEYILDSYRMDFSASDQPIRPLQIQKLSSLYPSQAVRWFASELIRTLIK